jgi:ribosomal protein S18 acetylase RimI-like enzyme
MDIVLVMLVEVEVVEEITDEVAAALAWLLPQLSRSTPPDAADLVRVASHPANTILLARQGGRIVGTLTLVVVPSLTGTRARIEDVVVDEASRGGGVGSALTVAALRLAEQARASTVDLTSRPSRVAANRLYVKLGFVPRDSQVYRFTS